MTAMALSEIEVEILKTEGLTRAQGEERFGEAFVNLWYRGHITPPIDGADPDTATFHPTLLGLLALKRYNYTYN